MSERRYRLDPQDRTGWMYGLAGPQLITLGLGIVVSVLLMQGGAPLGAAAPVMAVCAVLALVRIGGRSVLEWVPLVWRWVRSGGGKGQLWLAPLTGANLAEVATPPLPPPLDGQVILVAGEDSVAPIAVVHDENADTYAATLRVTGRQFALVERGEQENLLAMWGDALAPFCQERGPVVEVRWSEWAAPAGMEEQHAYLAEHMIDDPHDPAVVSYRQLLRTSAPVATRHEVLVTVVVSGGRVKARAAGADRRAVAIETLVNEVRLLRMRLERSGLSASAPLTPHEVARALRVRLDPTVIPTLDRRGRSLGDRAGLVEPADGGPLAAKVTWKHWQVDGSFHRAFYFREWPRSEVGATWMSDLLLYGDAVRTIAVSYQPVPPRVSQRTITRQAAKLESDAEHRRKTGFRVGAHHRRAAEAVEEREEELVAGFAEFEFAGLVTVTAATEAGLEKACADIVQVSAGCKVELRPLDGRQAEGVGACLPLARGVAPKGLLN
jgi:hypothetical protein